MIIEKNLTFRSTINMATVEKIKEELKSAKNEYNRCVEKLDRLEGLRGGEIEKYVGEREKLEKKEDKLEKEKEFWRGQVRKLQNALVGFSEKIGKRTNCV